MYHIWNDESWDASRNARSTGGCDFPLLDLLLEHRLPDAPPSIREPVLQLFLVDTSLLHEHGLILGSRVGVREVLRREQPRLERCYGARGELTARFGPPSLAIAASGVVVVIVGIRHAETLGHRKAQGIGLSSDA